VATGARSESASTARGDTTRRTGSRRKRLRYGILGGTFDPPHIGHLALAQEVYARLDLDRVWFVPAGQPPHKAGKPISSAADRLAMVELAIASDDRFALSTLELERTGPSYTADTLEALRVAWSGVTMVFMMGSDMLTYLPHWHAPERVVAAVDTLVASHRPGVPVAADEIERLESLVPGLREKLTVLPAPQLDVAASTLRERVASGLPIRYLVPDTVWHYIEERKLYASSGEQGTARSTGGARRARARRSSLEIC
jgi:nicotinate-nucleotide adenylyltransferase